ncbi:TPA: EexN family lipoprotein [Serratia marcescens]|uniref:EexN family lipoprotein n=1 Tax=Alloalcanivorax xenomutans TaxID=1094342 RepID=UPI0038C69426
MRKLTVLSLALMMIACGESAPTETVESLIANPERLAELRKQCRDNPAALGDELCNAVAEATRRRFMGDGNVPYTPPTEEPRF